MTYYKRDISRYFLGNKQSIENKEVSVPYQLRSGNTKATATMKKTKGANDFFSFRFS